MHFAFIMKSGVAVKSGYADMPVDGAEAVPTAGFRCTIRPDTSNGAT